MALNAMYETSFCRYSPHPPPTHHALGWGAGNGGESEF